MSIRLIFILVLVASLTGCGKKPSEETEEAIDIALTYLTEGNCDDAIEVLEDVGRDTHNAKYIQVLSSAYACRAGYSDIDFLDTEIRKLVTTNMATLFKSLTQLKWSDDEHEADSDNYEAMKEAINIVLNVTAGQPSQVDREDKFGPRNAGELGVQALFLNIAQLGKFLHFYGNVSAAGVKGGGAANTDEQGLPVSTCFAAYTANAARLALTPAVGGACRFGVTFVGHPDIDFADLTTAKRRMCEGLMLMTNIIDVLENLTLTGSSYGSLSTVATQVANFRNTAVTANPALEPLLTTTSQESCEALVADATEWDNLQVIFAGLFEVNFQ